MTQLRSKAMTTKRFILATSMIMFVTMSGHANAGTTISDQRYWPSEVSSAGQNEVQRPENVVHLAKTPRGIEANGPSYQGGPKES
jgi:hypothetical protein